MRAPALPPAVQTEACREARTLLREGERTLSPEEVERHAAILVRRSASDREHLESGMALAQAGPEGHAQVRRSMEMLDDALSASLVHGRIVSMAAGWPLAFGEELLPPLGGCAPLGVRPECVAALVDLLIADPELAARIPSSPELNLAAAEAALSRGEAASAAWNEAVLALREDRLKLALASWVRLAGGGLRVPDTQAARVELVARGSGLEGRRERVVIGLSLFEEPGDPIELGVRIAPHLERPGVPADIRALLLAAWFAASPDAATPERIEMLAALVQRARAARTFAQLGQAAAGVPIAPPGDDLDALIAMIVDQEELGLTGLVDALERTSLRGAYRRAALTLVGRRHAVALAGALAETPTLGLERLTLGDRNVLLRSLGAEAAGAARSLHAAAAGDPAAWLAGFPAQDAQAIASIDEFVRAALRAEGADERARARDLISALHDRRGAAQAEGSILLERAMRSLGREERGGQGEAMRRKLALLALRAEPPPTLEAALDARRAQTPARGAFRESVLVLHGRWQQQCAALQID